jgi:hypothetical protein
MGLFNRFIDAVSKLCECSRRKPVAQPRPSRFRVEALEPRLLLSADLIPQADLTAASYEELNSGAIVWFQEQPIAEKITIDLNAWDAQTIESPSPAITSDAGYQPETRNSEPETETVSTSTLTPYSSLTCVEDSSSQLAVTSFDDPGGVVAQLMETLRVANAPPMLSEMRLIDDDLSQLNGQIFFLDFDGASGVTYDGPVRVENIGVYPFQLPSDFAGSKTDFIDSVLASLNERFASVGVTFTTTVLASSFLSLEREDTPYSFLSLEGDDKEPAPDPIGGEGVQYSTIYIGGDDSAFSQYGSFFGLAEQVDIGNQDRSDNAFVFSNKIYRPGMSADAYTAALTEVIEHEALHLLGYAHADGRTDGLSSLADAPPEPAPEATITVNSTVDTNAVDEVLTLREAILIANGERSILSSEERSQVVGSPTAASLDLIRFDIPTTDPGFNPESGAWTIRPGVDTRSSGGGLFVTIVIDVGLPEITSPVIIDGTTQPGFNATTHMPIIEIDASKAASSDGFIGSGLVITAGNSTVKGLVINRAPANGISLLIRGGNTIIGNFIGTDLTGTVTDSFGNRSDGIFILDSADNQIGRANNGEGNLISGNFAGIAIVNGGSTGNRVQNNLIGTDITGRFQRGNDFGVLISSSGDRDDEASDN